MSFVDQLPAGGTTSLQRDLEEGKASELDAWNGAVVRLARDSGIDAPVHTFIYESLLPQTQESDS
jgi:2-dehydropantoate 2-reductase